MALTRDEQGRPLRSVNRPVSASFSDLHRLITQHSSAHNDTKWESSHSKRPRYVPTAKKPTSHLPVDTSDAVPARSPSPELTSPALQVVLSASWLVLASTLLRPRSPWGAQLACMLMTWRVICPFLVTVQMGQAGGGREKERVNGNYFFFGKLSVTIM